MLSAAYGKVWDGLVTDGLITLDPLGEVACEELEPALSRHTGRPLRRVDVGIVVSEDQSEKLVDIFAKARELEGALTEPDGSRWIVTNSSHSYREGDTMHRHHAELREAEELHPDRVEMLGLSIQPIRYLETAGETDLTIQFTGDFASADSDKLDAEIGSRREADDPYFGVRRVGLSDDPIRMRFGRCLWQRTEKGRAHLLYLVSEAGDSRERQRGWRLLDPEFGHAARKAVGAHAGVSALLAELVKTGALSEEAETRVRGRMNDQIDLRAFDEVSDLDEYFVT